MLARPRNKSHVNDNGENQSNKQEEAGDVSSPSIPQLKGDLPAAIAEYTKAQQLSDDLRIRVLLAAAKAQLGDKDAAVRLLAELEELSQHRYMHASWRAPLYLSLGNHDEAIRWLEKGVADHEGLEIAWIKVDPMLDPLRGDPRFEALVQQVVGAKHK